MTLIELAANQPADRFYTGGEQIRSFRGTGAPGSHVPEDWVGSATTLFGEARLGLTALPDGRLLRDALAADPVRWLGPEHAERWGADPGLLVKLLDAGQRLPVHAHPDRAFAAEHLGLAHGKTEAWVALEAADVRLGFRREVPPEKLAGWVARQDVNAMLEAMHVLRLEAGDAVLVPAGLPHAIGAGAFVVELQEPTDLSILVEWQGFAIDGAQLGHLGLGFDTALQALDRRAWSAAEIEALRGARGDRTGDLLPAAAPFFRVERWRGSSTWEPGFAVAVVTAGSGELRPEDGDAVAVRAGQTWLVDHAAGPVELAGERVEVLRCRPPAA
jgi:mannose-6-phosphate isomerase